MAEYNPDLEPTGDAEYSYKSLGSSGVTESDIDANKGWSHRSQLARNQHSKERERAISAEVEERREGKIHRLDELKQDTKHDESDESDNHGESHENDYEFGRPLTTMERAAINTGQYWSENKRREFLNKTDLTREHLGWN